LNQTAPHLMTQELDKKQCSHGHPQKFVPGGNVEILLICSRLLTMQCKWTFTKRFTHSTPLVCAGWISIFCLKCFLHFCYPVYLFFS